MSDRLALDDVAAIFAALPDTGVGVMSPEEWAHHLYPSVVRGRERERFVPYQRYGGGPYIRTVSSEYDEDGEFIREVSWSAYLTMHGSTIALQSSADFYEQKMWCQNNEAALRAVMGAMRNAMDAMPRYDHHWIIGGGCIQNVATTTIDGR